MFVDYLSKKYNLNEFKKFKNSKITEDIIEGKKVIFAKPQTYMNLSGNAVLELKKWFKVENKDIIIIYDDFDIPFESVRFREKGTGGTHNGMKDIILKLSDTNIPRLRIGTGGLKKDKEEVISFVLSKFSKDELSKIDNIFDEAYVKLKEFLDK